MIEIFLMNLLKPEKNMPTVHFFKTLCQLSFHGLRNTLNMTNAFTNMFDWS